MGFDWFGMGSWVVLKRSAKPLVNMHAVLVLYSACPEILNCLHLQGFGDFACHSVSSESQGMGFYLMGQRHVSKNTRKY